MISKPTVNCARAAKRLFLTAFNEAHAHARGLAGALAGQPLGAAPGTEAAVVVGGLGVSDITMCAPAVAVFGAGEFRATTQLRAAGEAARIVRRPAVAQRGENIAASRLVAEEVRRRRHHCRIRRFGRHPIDAGKVETTDAAGLVTTGTGNVVQPAFKTSNRT